MSLIKVVVSVVLEMCPFITIPLYVLTVTCSNLFLSLSCAYVFVSFHYVGSGLN